jgi:hypothetical protein
MGKLQMISAMQTMLTYLTTEEVFVKDDTFGLAVAQVRKNGELKWIVREVIGGNYVEIYPSVIHEDTASYKGVGIYINEVVNRVEMSIAEFIALQQFLKEVDIWGLSQSMFNSALILAGNMSLDRDPAPIAERQEEFDFPIKHTPRGKTMEARTHEIGEKEKQRDDQCTTKDNGS